MGLYFVNVGLVVVVVGNKDVSTRGRYAARIARSLRDRDVAIERFRSPHGDLRDHVAERGTGS